MKSSTPFASMAYGFVGAGVFFVLTKAGPAVAQVAASIPYVRLQPTTPGTQESGHSNISGTARAGQFIGSGGGLTNVNATLLDGIDSTAFLQAVPNPLSLTSTNAAAVITGTNSNTLTGAAGIKGVSNAPSGTTYGLWGLNSSPSGRGVFGETTSATGLTYGGRFESNSTSGRGVYGFSIASSGSTYGVFGQSNSTTGRGVYGYGAANTGENYGGYFDSDSTTGYGLFATSAGTYGLYAESTVGTGLSYGGRFRAESTAGVAVSGASIASSGNTYAGRFESNSTSGRGVLGWATAVSGATFGVWGKTESPTGRAIFGDAAGTGTGGYFLSGTGLAMEAQSGGLTAVKVTATGLDLFAGALEVSGFNGIVSTGSESGVTGRAAHYGLYGSDNGNNPDGRGVFGVTNSSFGCGVLGTAIGAPAGSTGVRGLADYDKAIWGTVNNTGSGTSYGVYGESNGATARGVLGTVTSTAGVNYGVRGVNSNAAGYAVYAAGNSATTGTKSFVIDHPFDPLNKYLKHYCAEGPVPQNVYNGTVVTDGTGWATVSLPDYFTAINKDPRVQLTVNDSSEEFVMVKMVGEVSGNTFRIRTSKPRVKVYWEVKATRNDLYLQAHPPKVEVDKDPSEKGKYQHPDLYGQPKEMGVDFDAQAERARARAARESLRSASLRK